MTAIHTEPHLHLNDCVADRCASTCPRRGRPAGPDGRCACATCTDPHMRYGVTDVWEHPGKPLVSRIVAAATDSEPTRPQEGDGVDDEVAGLIADHEWRTMIGLADVMGLVGDWGTDDVEQAVIEAAHRYRELAVPRCPACASAGWVCSVCDHVMEGDRGACGAYHSEYGFTCPWLPRGHGGAHFDAAGGHWTEAGQVTGWTTGGAL